VSGDLQINQQKLLQKETKRLAETCKILLKAMFSLFCKREREAKAANLQEKFKKSHFGEKRKASKL